MGAWLAADSKAASIALLTLRKYTPAIRLRAIRLRVHIEVHVEVLHFTPVSTVRTAPA